MGSVIVNIDIWLGSLATTCLKGNVNDDLSLFSLLILVLRLTEYV